VDLLKDKLELMEKDEKKLKATFEEKEKNFQKVIN